MKKLMLFAVLLGGCYVSGSGRVHTGVVVAEPVATVEVETAPPPPQEVVVVETRPGFVWIEPHWQWRGGRYVWARGYYERERVGHRWVQGRWENRGRRHVWVEGRWEAHGGPAVRDHRDRGPVVRDHRH